MALEMREICEKCDAPLGHLSEAFICSYECTWCGPCTTAMKHVCPNCGGRLEKRPTRQSG